MLYLSTKAMLKNHNKGNMQQDIKQPGMPIKLQRTFLNKPNIQRKGEFIFNKTEHILININLDTSLQAQIKINLKPENIHQSAATMPTHDNNKIT